LGFGGGRDLSPSVKRYGAEAHIKPISPRSRWFASTIVAIILGLPICLSLLNYWQQYYPGLSATKAVTSFEGTIEIGVLESRASGQALSVYSINPSAGSITLTRKADIELGSRVSSEPLPAGAHISRCPDGTDSSVSSPNNRFAASCVREQGKSSVIVTDVLAKTLVKNILIANFFNVRGIAWSPDSRAVAVLEDSERKGYGPFELASALSGHPVPYSSIGFAAVSISENEGTGLPYIAREFRSAWSYIRWQH
jgi:hypothetical protein